MAGWVVVRVTVTKSTGERNKWQDMSLKVSQFYFDKTFLFWYPGLPESDLAIPDLWSCQFVR